MGREDSFFKPALIVDFRGIVRRLLANSSTGMPREDAEQLLLRELKAVSADAKDQGFADADVGNILNCPKSGSKGLICDS